MRMAKPCPPKRDGRDKPGHDKVRAGEGYARALFASARGATICPAMLRRYLLRPLWVVLALLFLLEAWLWDHLKPLVARLVALIPLAALKRGIARLVASLPPWAVLFVFAIPFVLMLPLKFAEVYFLARRQWVLAAAVILLVKLVGVGVTAFIFDVTRDKLMQMAWFRRLYAWVMWARDWAHAQTEPIRQRVRQLVWLLRPQRAGTFLRRLIRLRRRAWRRR